METHQYRFDENVYGTEENQLLDYDGLPSEHLKNRQAKALANIASAIHLNKDNLRESQIEQVVLWLKRIKISQNYPTGMYPGTHQDGFYRILNEIRESREQVRFQKQANIKAMKSNIAAVLLFISLLAILTLWLAEVPGWISAIPIVLSFFIFGFMQSYTKEALIIAKEQDRRYFMECLRRAENVDELNEAGLFMYLKGMSDEDYDSEKALASAKKEVDRLRNALYTQSRLLDD
jgi:hypothetical protein